MILQLFLAFLKIGAVSFGGGYGMISLIRETVLGSGWLTEAEFLNLIAISESTPGPIAVNMATYVGSAQAGLIGALAATFGVVLPSFCVILLIAALLRNLMKYRPVQAFLDGVRPCVVGLILAVALTLLLRTLFAYQTFADTPVPDGRAMLIFAILIAISAIRKRMHRKRLPPIAMIAISAGLGIVLFGFN